MVLLMRTPRIELEEIEEWREDMQRWRRKNVMIMMKRWDEKDVEKERDLQRKREDCIEYVEKT